MKWRKAKGEDGVVIEMMEAGRELVVNKIMELANQIYSTGCIPEQMKQSVFIIIPKKQGEIKCEKHRTISITSQIKIILKVIRERILMRVMERVDNVQFGFRKGKGTRNTIFMLRTLVEKALENRKMYTCAL